MKSGPESEDFEIQESPDEGVPPDHISGFVDIWKPIKDELFRAFDIKISRGPASSPTIYGGKVKAWKSVTGEEEEMRRILAPWIMGLFSVWMLVGLIVFLVSGNFWLLAESGILTWPVTKVLSYYFRSPKK